MSAPDQGNTYLEKVVAQQAVLEDDLRARRSAPAVPGMPAAAPPAGPLAKRERALGAGPGADRSGPGPVDVRISGFWRWKNVLVPPNAFVVHTRRGRTEPLHIGLGVSFRFNPSTDSFLVVPGATQTILINAYCICRELQGVLVQGYVQWIIQDFGTAYRKLDFGDADDPMRVVNLQLREQAEAAIKDKVATMGVRDVLSDKQPIIEELTARLRAVAEGEESGDQGLGLRIVTVQIKEAVVSSSRLWENLQKPYRSEQGQIARLAELEAEEAVARRGDGRRPGQGDAAAGARAGDRRAARPQRVAAVRHRGGREAPPHPPRARRLPRGRRAADRDDAARAADGARAARGGGRDGAAAHRARPRAGPAPRRGRAGARRHARPVPARAGAARPGAGGRPRRAGERPLARGRPDAAHRLTAGDHGQAAQAGRAAHRHRQRRRPDQRGRPHHAADRRRRRPPRRDRGRGPKAGA
ncbi:SPFH domain-containing protein [Actinomadura madurae]|uniref:SPFH domain-containing protein n=1 Tax=Actinomadura madurae TaxID=1993 RepID=UPI0020267EC3|nr:SPFH domain-containing protein [Actinomadura madurae]URM99542.1 SPFH domain-containing protein [Actinomadura madurae]